MVITSSLTNDELTEKELKQVKADDQPIQTILIGLLEDIYATIDSCEIAQEIWLRVQQIMKGSDIGIQDKKDNCLMNGKGLLPLMGNRLSLTIIHQPVTIADNVPNAMSDDNSFVNPFATPSTSAAESSSSQYVDPSNMHTFYQPYPHEYQWTKDHPLEHVIGEPS
ncbi:hypothetical protein Tco_0023818 [Tanacetum coccineum]